MTKEEQEFQEAYHAYIEALREVSRLHAIMEEKHMAYLNNGNKENKNNSFCIRCNYEH